jgi:hypothetical protein
LTKFQLLTRDDVKASTAILDPNIPGSSTIRLSGFGPAVQDYQDPPQKRFGNVSRLANINLSMN